MFPDFQSLSEVELIPVSSVAAEHGVSLQNIWTPMRSHQPEAEILNLMIKNLCRDSTLGFDSWVQISVPCGAGTAAGIRI